MARLKCKVCGKNLTPDAAFCPACGTRAGTTERPALSSEATRGVTRRNCNLSFTLETYDWLDDGNLRSEFSRRGIRSRSAVVQDALDEYFANHVYRGADGKLHDKDSEKSSGHPSVAEDRSSVWKDNSYR